MSENLYTAYACASTLNVIHALLVVVFEASEILLSRSAIVPSFAVSSSDACIAEGGVVRDLYLPRSRVFCRDFR